MADNRRAYGLAKEHGIDTTGMSPKEVWEALKEKGVSEEEVSSDGNGGTHEATEAEKGRMEELGYSDSDSEDISSLLGEEFTGVKGQAAIDKLLQERRGHVKGAFHRDDIGDIDLLWGNDDVGLRHIIKQRDKEKEGHTEEILSNLTESIEKGAYEKRNDRGNFEFIYKKDGVKFKIIIAPEFHKNKITYVLTAFRRGKKK